MVILDNVSLKRHNTFRLDCKADCLVSIGSEKDAVSLFTGDYALPAPILIIGRGSNILFTSHFRGTVLQANISGTNIEKQDDEFVIVSAGAGVDWDKFVGWTVSKGFWGLENLSLIPGRVGAAPVQNIGAYGVEVKDMVVRVNTISTKDGSKRVFRNEECRFKYRDSIFKNEKKGQYLITRVYFRLKKFPSLYLEYGSLKDEVNKLGEPTLMNIRNAVITIRRNKLPDPELIGNAGSFFKNPVVSNAEAEAIRKQYPDLACFKDPSGGIKLAAGWLIEQCGWKGKRIGNAGVHEKQSLVLVNHGKASGWDIYKLSEKIRESVLKRFGVNLEREVEIVGPT